MLKSPAKITGPSNPAINFVIDAHSLNRRVLFVRSFHATFAGSVTTAVNPVCGDARWMFNKCTIPPGVSRSKDGPAPANRGTSASSSPTISSSRRFRTCRIGNRLAMKISPCRNVFHPARSTSESSHPE